MNSKQLFEQARQYIPGGVNSPVRAFASVGTDPVFIDSAFGSKIKDAEGKEYIDYVGSWGPMILGHGYPDVVDALLRQMVRGISYGAPTELEVELARMVCERVPSVEMVRMVNSGTEATMSAIRLARGYTRRDKIVKFEGCYHGHSDGLLVKAGSGALTFGVPTSPGVPADYAKHTLTATFNDLASVEELFKAHPEDIACVILEPVPGNMGVIHPDKAFMSGLRQLTEKYGSLLIFDEVMSGFRLSPSGYQGLNPDVQPDLSTYGKVIGGGLPVGAYGGKKAIMEMISPAGPVYQAGTLSGNPLAMVAGIQTLKATAREGFYTELDARSAQLSQAMSAILKEVGIPHVLNQLGSMFTIFFTEQASVNNFADAVTSDTKRFGAFFRAMLENGVYLPASQFEACFMGGAHSDKDIDATLEACRKAAKAL
ncbi:glutamate-1-semialdehyde 2,1-aminomutase [Desulfurispirillum indicum]|uniref:Glutamate-1-semialdehyde 2,1-aminomutase n=1 Tax=Desulfurispirillum indicum (strain ATCC BAA-1389 / DSM 22839 / S5) TaxID=653733 RepID=E6W0J7_DESIS|nr:glutamate-1-semialdehyde 2,1-aminomutase [Desulfurispirillum indicum]ADU65249.1 glutamate-1-semialdehyde-2,1-aminomutase [Desulfurispirillum indicum S5]UCZ57147.1 glutamate-1-semialdehyde 2,1-aminomutase [Desulfurispirillum indicum]